MLEHITAIRAALQLLHPELAEHGRAMASLAAIEQAMLTPVAWGMPRGDGQIVDVITPEEHERQEGEYTAPLFAAPPAQQALPIEIELRKLLCVTYAGGAAYMDDGEAQDSRALPVIDFLRDTPAEIQKKMQQRSIKQAQVEAAPCGWLVSDSEGDDEYVNNRAALVGRHYRGRVPQPLFTAPKQAEAVPLQKFESPRAKILMRAWQEGWAACRDSKYVGKEAENDAFNQSQTVNHCIAEDVLATHQQAESSSRGYVTAPAEPTDEMVDAACEAVDDLYRVDFVRAYAAAIAAAPKQAEAVPQGWKLVPVEPTPEMVRAGWNLLPSPPSHKWDMGASQACLVYRAMLAAAPQPKGGA